MTTTTTKDTENNSNQYNNQHKDNNHNQNNLKNNKNQNNHNFYHSWVLPQLNSTRLSFEVFSLDYVLAPLPLLGIGLSVAVRGGGLILQP